jgi:hypothetical protein
MRIRLLGSEVALSTSSGNTFGNATVVRLVNPTAGAVVITLRESDDTTAVGTFTIAAGQTEFLEKDSDQRIRSASTSVLGVKVGYTH